MLILTFFLHLRNECKKTYVSRTNNVTANGGTISQKHEAFDSAISMSIKSNIFRNHIILDGGCAKGNVYIRTSHNIRTYIRTLHCYMT